MLQAPSAAWAPTPACPSTGSATASATVPTGAMSCPQQAVVGLHLSTNVIFILFRLMACPLCWWRLMAPVSTQSGILPSLTQPGASRLCPAGDQDATGIKECLWWKWAHLWLGSFIALPEENAAANVREVMHQEGRFKFYLQFILTNCSDPDISCPIKCYFQFSRDTFPLSVSGVQWKFHWRGFFYSYIKMVYKYIFYLFWVFLDFKEHLFRSRPI